jgi:hypothetical protein
MRSRWLLLFLSWVASPLFAGGDFPALVFPEGVGVNIHFTRGHEQDLDLIAAAGFKFIRMDFSWGATERHKGEYHWADYEELTAGLERRGLRAIYILDYSNRLYEENNDSPQHAESVAAFARWAGAAARHFKGRRILWEIWNEPNISFWKPKPDVQQYISLARATCRAVRENDPDATLIAPASSEFPWDFFEEMFQAGLLEQLDAVSVHPYRHYQRSPETVAGDYLRLRSLIERYAPTGKKAMPILSGEWGYSSHRQGVSLETQAAFLVRQQLVNLAHRIPVSIWYDWKNDGPDPGEGEHNFGTVYPDLKPKPAYEAVRCMTRELAGFRLLRRLDVADPQAYVLLLANAAGEQKLAAWCTGLGRTVSLDVGLRSPGALSVVDGLGKPQTAGLDGGTLELPLEPLPLYVTFKERGAPLSAAAAWEIREPFARSVKAGKKDALSIQLTIRNPFAETIHATASLTGSEIAAEKKIRLAPGRSAELTLSGTVSRRDLAVVPATVALEARDVGGRMIGRSAESLSFQITNPLRLTVAPTEDAVRVTVEDLAGDTFRGRVEAGKEKHPLALGPRQRVASVTFPPPGAMPAPVIGPFTVVAKGERRVAQIPIMRLQPIQAGQFDAKLDGDGKISAFASVKAAPAPGDNPPFRKAFALDYQFEEGWRFVRCETGAPTRLGSRPRTLGVWIDGDNSGNSLRTRVRDASGQTFQINGPSLNWSGWRWVTFDLEHLEHAGHWGGANDGMVKGELTLETPLLLDGTRRKTRGKIWFAGLMVVY